MITGQLEMNWLKDPYSIKDTAELTYLSLGDGCPPKRTRSAVAQETRVFRIPQSLITRLDKFDAWSTSQHSFYDEPPVNCNIMALTVAPTLLTSARQQHLLHLPTLQLCGWEHAQTLAQMLPICHQEVFCHISVHMDQPFSATPA